MNNTATLSKYETADIRTKNFGLLLEDVACALDAAHWSRTYDRAGEMTLRDGVVIHACIDPYSGKVEYSLGNQKNVKGEVFTARNCMDYDERKGATPVCLSVNVSSERTPKAIAADITRRLLPDARKFWARLTQQVQNSNDYIAGCASQAERFAQLLGTQPSGNYNSNRAEKTFCAYNVAGTHSVTVYKDSVSFSFNGSPELALQLLAIMKAAHVAE